MEERLRTIAELRNAGLEVYATLAPLLPCNPERLATLALDASGRDLIGDPLHVRGTKPRGATTRAAAMTIAQQHGEMGWFAPEFQAEVVARIRKVAEAAGRDFAVGPGGFGRLAQKNPIAPFPSRL
jgi:DNA repair photolyase